MKSFKLIHRFQYNHWADNIQLNRPAYPLDWNKKIDNFDIFSYLEFTDSLDFSKPSFFPVFLQPYTLGVKKQLEELYEFVKNNRPLFSSGKLTIILLDPLEASGKPTVDVLDDFAKKVQDLCPVYYIDGDKKFKPKYLKHYYVNHWIRHPLHHANQPDEILPLDDDNKTYIFLNKRIRAHRAMLLSAIVADDLRKDGYIAWTGEVDCFPDWPRVYPNILSETYDILDFENVMEKNPTQYVPIEHCKKSFLFLNTETHYDSERLFITEKTYKPFRIGMPFITLSHPGTLAELQNLGFKTFSQWIDESYDEKTDTNARIGIIVKELKRFANMSPKERQRIKEEMRPILQHNKDLVLNLTRTKHDLMDALEQISNESTK